MISAVERTVRADGLRIHVREVGEGPPVLLVNGLGSNTGVWATMEGVLDGFHLIEFDAPGTGRSPAPLRPVSIPRLARLAAAVLDAAGAARADVLGYSLGGIVAQQLAADAPERVRRLVLVGTGVGLGGVTGDARSLLHILAPVRYLSPRLYARSMATLTGGRARTDRAWVDAFSADRLQLPPTMRGYFGQLMSVSGWSGLPLLERIPHPALVVGGDDDPLAPPANTMLLACRLPQGRMLLAPGEGHLMLVDPDSAVLEPIRAFLEAEPLETSDVWREATVVEEQDVRTAIASRRQSQPMGALGALARRRWPSADPGEV